MRSLDGSVIPDGVVVARDDGLGTTLWRLSGPLVSTNEGHGALPERHVVGAGGHVAASSAARPAR